MKLLSVMLRIWFGPVSTEMRNLVSADAEPVEYTRQVTS